MDGKKIFVRADLPADKDDRKDLVTNGLESGIVNKRLRKLLLDQYRNSPWTKRLSSGD